MGLDMYLTKNHYIGNKYRDAKKRVKVVVPKTQKGVTFPTRKIKDVRVSEITEEVAYWRKANQIHKWFVDNVQDGNDDCKTYDVSREQLLVLRDLCLKVIHASKLVKGKIANGQTMKDGKWSDIMVDGEYIEDPTVAKELLPAQEGFFFGGTAYDQYYLDDIKYTAKTLTAILEEDDAYDFHYRASW